MPFLEMSLLGTPAWMWFAFLGVVILLLVLDLGVLHRKQREIGVRESLGLSALYIAAGLAFGAWVWSQRGEAAGLAYVTGFVIEKSLAIDNVFVIAMIFTYFAVPRIYQHRVLFWGILGVIVLRAIMIALGATLVEKFSWTLYIFGAFLVITGIKMWRSSDKPYDVASSPIVVWMKRRFRITDRLHGEAFWVKQPDPASGKEVWFMTPLLLALVMVEFVDVIFAVDSVPAIFAVTTDAYIVYTSNIFAILGLRALYFALSAVIDKFAYLKQALALVLIFIGGKIFAADLLGIAKIPPAISLTVTMSLIAGGVIYSIYRSRKDATAVS